MSKRFKILAVDDEPINLQLISAALKNEYDVLTATNGYHAIAQLKEQRPDLILLDVMMPDMNGFDVCSNIKADASFVDIPVIFLTALDPNEGELRGLEIGGIDYLMKPVNFELLKLRVRNHLALKERNEMVIAQRDLLEIQKKELEEALARVKHLEGIIPICMYCKKIRDDQNTWNQLEQYISEHSEAKFSHGICPKCVQEQMEIIKNM
ncbi:MAG: response regulator [Desulfuromonadaceae bacterium]|nr:response regulator [Desulfuromonadaceae bacterium]